MKRTGANMPDHWLFLPIEPANVLVATCFGFGDSRADGGLDSAPTMLDTGLSAAKEDLNGFWFSAPRAAAWPVCTRDFGPASMCVQRCSASAAGWDSTQRQYPWRGSQQFVSAGSAG